MKAVDLVPHRGPMLLIDELCKNTSEITAGKTIISSGNPFADSKGRLDPVCFIELLAQLAAASKGHDAINASGSVKNGYLAGISDFVIHKGASVGNVLNLNLKKTLEMDNITVAEGAVYHESTCLAEGKLKLYVTDMDADAKAALAGGKYTPKIMKVAGTRSTIHDSILRNMKGLEISPDNKASAEFKFDETFPGFDGHFPGFAILPGVAMVGMTLAVCESLADCALSLVRIETAKFSKLLLPNDLIKAALDAEKDGETYKVKAKLISEDGKTAASFMYLAKKDAT